MRIEKIHHGLPAHLQDEILWVADEFRTNPLSLEPGGSDIVVEYHSNPALGYVRIKHPGKYVEAILDKLLGTDKETLNRLSDAEKLELAKSKIHRFYLRTYDSDEERDASVFGEAWSSDSAVEMPYRALGRKLRDIEREDEESFNDEFVIDEDGHMLPRETWNAIHGIHDDVDYFGY